MSLETEGAPTASSPAAEPKTEIEGALALESSTPAESSNADDEGAKPADLLSVVKDAVQKEEPAAVVPPATEGEGEAQPVEAEAKPVEGEADADAQAEADAKLPFHNHPRWKEVIAERDGFREDAGRFRNIDSFMQQNNLLPEEVAEGFDIMAKLKSGEPEALQEARSFFASRLEALDNMLGLALPDDLQARVDSGEMTEDAAKELAEAKASAALRESQAEAREQRTTEERQREAAVTAANAMATAVDTWEQRQKTADPDYAKKSALVETTCRAIVQETGQPPRNAAEAVALAEAALKRVNEQAKSLLPTPKRIVPAPLGSSAPTVNAPATLKDAIRASVAG